MRHVAYALSVLFATCAPASAQSGVTGTWDVEGRPVRMVLVAKGSAVTGTAGGSEIFDGHIDGTTITFKWKSADGDRTITVMGQISGDEMAFTREVQVREGGNPGGAGFSGGFGPPRFTMKRVPAVALAAELAATATQVRGMEFAAAINVLQKDVKVEGTLFLPQTVSRVRAVIVVTKWGLGQAFYEDPQLRRLVETTEASLLLARFSDIGPTTVQASNRFTADGADALLLLLQRLAQDSAHQELMDAPLLVWGHSAAGSFGSTFAAAHPQRTIAFVGYHSASVGGGDMKVLRQLPALLLAGGKDAPNMVEGAETLWKRGRSAGAPWTFGVEPEAVHQDPKDLTKANDLVISWIAAVLRQRLSATGGPLRVVSDASAWLGNIQTGEVASAATFRGPKSEASWLPDEQSARGWRVVVAAAR